MEADTPFKRTEVWLTAAHGDIKYSGIDKSVLISSYFPAQDGFFVHPAQDGDDGQRWERDNVGDWPQLSTSGHFALYPLGTTLLCFSGVEKSSAL